jgi:hypothetical protein
MPRSVIIRLFDGEFVETDVSRQPKSFKSETMFHSAKNGKMRKWKKYWQKKISSQNRSRNVRKSRTYDRSKEHPDFISDDDLKDFHDNIVLPDPNQDAINIDLEYSKVGDPEYFEQKKSQTYNRELWKRYYASWYSEYYWDM